MKITKYIYSSTLIKCNVKVLVLQFNAVLHFQPTTSGGELTFYSTLCTVYASEPKQHIFIY